MKRRIEQTIKMPEAVVCVFENKILKCKKDSTELSRTIDEPQIEIKISNNEITLLCEKGNKNQYNVIMTLLAHIKNIFAGLDEKFVYHLESVNVHFPMTLKIEGNKLIINNFLGEKTPRQAKILPNVEVEIKAKKITVSSNDKESAGQTAANFEKATKVKGKDIRIYQDGIYITKKPVRSKDD